MKPTYFPTTLRTGRLIAVSRPDGRWTVRQRGAARSVMTHDELLATLNAKPKKHGRKQPRQ